MLENFEEKDLRDFLFKFINEKTFKNCENEEELRVEFQNLLNELARKMELTDSYLSFKNETRLRIGRSDFLYGNTIIEYKKYGKLSNFKEKEKAKKTIKRIFIRS